jgi:hypothetical protein
LTLETRLLSGDVSKQTHDSILAQIQAPSKSAMPDTGMTSSMAQGDAMKPPPRKQDLPRPPDASTMAGLLLGSPEFQKR